MKKQLFTFTAALIFAASLSAQFGNTDDTYSLNFGAGLFTPFLEDEGVLYDNAIFNAETSYGFTYFASFDYALSSNLAIGIGFNGNYAKSNFIQEATVSDVTVQGYLEAGAIANSHFLLNMTYSGDGDGIQPYAKIGLGYFLYQAEMGDVPIELTGGVEEEIFPDFKYNGFGALPELGVRYNSLSISVAYSLPFGELEGEEVPGGYISPGTVNLNGLQVNLSCRLGFFE